MSISNSNITTDSQFSKIIIISYKQQALNDNNIEQIVLDKNTHEPIGFNNIIQQKQNMAILGFLSRHDEIINQQSIIDILDIFKQNTHINFVYADNIIYNNNNISMSNYFPSTIAYNTFIQTPIFIKLFPRRFCEQLQELYFHKMILDLSSCSIGYHIPQFICRTQQHPINLMSDINIINGNSN